MTPRSGWSNGSEQVIGRANTEVFELNSVVRAGANQLETVQNGDTVLLVDHANATVDTIDPATSQSSTPSRFRPIRRRSSSPATAS